MLNCPVWAILNRFFWLLLLLLLLRLFFLLVLCSRLIDSLVISTSEVKCSLDLFRLLTSLGDPFEEFLAMGLQLWFESLLKQWQSGQEVLLEVASILCFAEKISLLYKKCVNVRPLLRVLLETRVDERSKLTTPVVVVGK